MLADWELDEIRRRHGDVPALIEEVQRLQTKCTAQAEALKGLLRHASPRGKKDKIIWEVIKELTRR